MAVNAAPMFRASGGREPPESGSDSGGSRPPLAKSGTNELCPTQTYWLGDGYHRVLAARKAGLTEIGLPYAQDPKSVGSPASPEGPAAHMTLASLAFTAMLAAAPALESDIRAVAALPGEPHIVGRTVYQLEIRPDGFLLAIAGNDDPNAPGPWTEVNSGASMPSR